jgi:hypothetical protein
MIRSYRQSIWVGISFLASLLLLTTAAGAINYNKGLYGACQYGSCSITISSSTSVSLNVTPTAAGSCTVQKDSVSVQTSNSAGYSLTFTDSTTNAALFKGASTIATNGASQSSPAVLTANKWGYRVDGIGGFGSGPTSAKTNAVADTTKFASIPTSNATPDVLATSSVAANPAVTTNVWYGVCANTTVPSGTYTTQITYTAVAS